MSSWASDRRAADVDFCHCAGGATHPRAFSQFIESLIAPILFAASLDLHFSWICSSWRRQSDFRPNDGGRRSEATLLLELVNPLRRSLANNSGASQMDRSVYQARWVLAPIFGLCLGFAAIGVLAG
jgi:hypothetical protein